jgi:putative phosphoesterase
MRLALLSDIHANQHALEAVWEDLERQRPEAVYCLGDLVGYGAYPTEVVDFLRQRGVPTVMGNYDDGVGFDLDECGCAYTTEADRERGQASLDWSRAHTRDDAKAFLRSLPHEIRLEKTRPFLLLVHGSPRKINEYVYEDRPEASFERLAALAQADVVAFGHTHRPYQKHVGATLFVNTGSVGKPRDGDPRAGYVLLQLEAEPKVEIRRVAYDVEAAARAIREAGLPPHFADLLLTGGLESAAGGSTTSV